MLLAPHTWSAAKLGPVFAQVQEHLPRHMRPTIVLHLDSVGKETMLLFKVGLLGTGSLKKCPASHWAEAAQARDGDKKNCLSSPKAATGAGPAAADSTILLGSLLSLGRVKLAGDGSHRERRGVASQRARDA